MLLLLSTNVLDSAVELQSVAPLLQLQRQRRLDEGVVSLSFELGSIVHLEQKH